MKKQLLLLFATLAISLATYAEHEYITILSPSNEWVELCYQHYVQYTVGEKAELYGKNYYTINETEMSLPDKAISHSTYNSLYREENKKLYKLNVDEDFLVFDFGANAGDTIVLKPQYPDEERNIVIDSIKTITLNGKERNVFYVHYISNYGDDDDVWIEGTVIAPYIGYGVTTVWGNLLLQKTPSHTLKEYT